MDPIRNDKTLQLLQAALDVSAKRHAAISSNLANIDTPGYKAHDIDFNAVMAEISEGLDQTSVERAAREREAATDWVYADEVPNLVERFDGNNVDLDREMANMAANSGQYRLANQLLQMRMRLIHEQLRSNV